MASRQATLLALGYNSGRLNFEYPNGFSYAREQYLLSEIEKEKIGELVKLQIQLTCALLPVNPKLLPIGKRQINEYLDLSLPYMNKQDSIINVTKTTESGTEQTTGIVLSEEEMAYWNNVATNRET